MSKKLEQKQQRRLAEERRRAEQRKEALRRNFVTIAVALLVLVLVVVAIIFQRQDEGEFGAIGPSAAEAGCGPVEETESEGRGHLGEGEPHPPYETDPPTSGPHYEIPADLGFYSEPLPPEQVVHNMEHGQIVLWYRPDLPSNTIDQIEELVDREASATVAVPYDNIQGDDAIVFTAWTASQTCAEVSEAALNEFRRQFQGKAPEPITPPFEG
ncbi:MAG: DUF3105 domain-containing protein [Actinomycetota bacterium]